MHVWDNGNISKPVQDHANDQSSAYPKNLGSFHSPYDRCLHHSGKWWCETCILLERTSAAVRHEARVHRTAHRHHSSRLEQDVRRISLTTNSGFRDINFSQTVIVAHNHLHCGKLCDTSISHILSMPKSRGFMEPRPGKDDLLLESQCPSQLCNLHFKSVNTGYGRTQDLC